MLQIQFFSLIRMLLKRDAIEIPWLEGDTVLSVLDKTQAQIATPFLHKLLDGSGTAHTGTIILVNEAWRAAANRNPPLHKTTALCEGANYLEILDKVKGPEKENARETASAYLSHRHSCLDYPVTFSDY